MSESSVPLRASLNQSRTKTFSGTSLLDAFLRRGMDITAAVFGLLLLTPLFIWIAVRLRRDSPGPTFYRGPRIGRDGKIFGILKFRTMYEKPESYQGSLVTGKGDARITPFGAWLRNTKMNELPQLWNVLVGDMSLVGPRPEDPTISERWPEAIRREFFTVRPGITSPATILYRDEETQLQNQHSVLDDYLRDILPSKLRLDLLYIKNRNFLSDLDIIFWTVVVLLPKIKQMPIPEYRLYWGPLANFTSRYLIWLMIDALVAFASLGLTGLLWRSSGPLDIGVLPSIGLALVISLLFSLINAAFGLYAVEWNRAPASYVISLAISTACSILIAIYPFKRLVPGFERLPDGLLVVAALIALSGFITMRYKERLLTGIASRWLSMRGGASAVGERILIVGAGENSKVATWFLKQSKLSPAFTVVGIIDDDPRKVGLKYEDYRVIGSTSQIPTLARKFDIGIIFYTITNITPQDRNRILRLCNQCEAIVVILPDMLNSLQKSFTIANTMDLDDLPESQPESPESLIVELESLAQAEQWDALKNRLSEYRHNGGAPNGSNRYLTR